MVLLKTALKRYKLAVFRKWEAFYTYFTYKAEALKCWKFYTGFTLKILMLQYCPTDSWQNIADKFRHSEKSVCPLPVYEISSWSDVI